MDRGGRSRHGELSPRRVRLFLDTSVVLAACASTAGASSEIFRRAAQQRWLLLTTPYVLEEVTRNLAKFPLAAASEWAGLRPHLRTRDNILTLNRPVVFPAGKDRPILFGAVAWADILLRWIAVTSPAC